MNNKNNGPRVLALDIETSLMETYVWSLGEQYINHSQIKKDWNILSWSAKWVGEDKILYKDQRNAKDKSNDKELLKDIWTLIDQADILLTQNGKRFDVKKLNSRFIVNGFQPPSSYKHMDTLQINKKYFGFSSNSLEYLAEKLNLKHKKLKHKRFPGMELWKECLDGNNEAWKDMEKYNKNDVLALIDLWDKVKAWDTTAPNFNLYNDSEKIVCKCGSKDFLKRGYHYTSVGKYQRYRCNKCGTETKDRTNLFDKDKKKSLRN